MLQLHPGTRQRAVVPSFLPVPTIEPLNGGFGLMMAAAATAAAANDTPACLEETEETVNQRGIQL